MEKFAFGHLITNLNFIAEHLRWQDAIDMILVWIVVYRILVLVRRSGTVQMLSGLGILAIAYILSIWLELYTFNWILESFFANLFLIVVILFQGEIRMALAHIGSAPFFGGASLVEETHIIEEISKAVNLLAQRGHGGLIVIEREISLDYHVEHGMVIDSRVSSELLLSVFHPEGPIHDGAVLIRDGKIHSAGTFLPLSKNPVLDKNLGTRHRAAIGLSEETDALILVISEENRSVGVVQGGHLKSNLEPNDIRRALYDGFESKGKQ